MEKRVEILTMELSKFRNIFFTNVYMVFEDIVDYFFFLLLTGFWNLTLRIETKRSEFSGPHLEPTSIKGRLRFCFVFFFEK